MISKATRKAKAFLEQPVNVAFGALGGIFQNHEQLNEQEQIIMALIKATLPVEAEAQEREIVRFRMLLEEESYSERKIEYLVDFLRSCAPVTPEKALPVLHTLDRDSQRRLLKFLVLLTALEDSSSQTGTLIGEIATELGFSLEELANFEQEARKSFARRTKLIKSGTGIILALIVIAVFILFAAYLASVLFGLLLAYMFLPLEKYFERKLQAPDGHLLQRFKKALQVIFPFGVIRKKLLRHASNYELSPEEKERRERKGIIARATTLTVSCFLGALLLFLILFSMGVASYVGNLSNSVSHWVHTQRSTSENAVIPEATLPATAAEPETVVPDVAPESASDTVSGSSDLTTSSTTHTNTLAPLTAEFTAKVTGFLDNLKLRFQNFPPIRYVIDELAYYLNQEAGQKELMQLILKKSGGIFAFTAGLVSSFTTLLLNILLTIFFFSLFLGKIASFTSEAINAGRKPTSYLIRLVFNGKWLPQIKGNSLDEGDRIITEVIVKIQTWLRGYLTMVSIDFCVYTTMFCLLKVPYAPILGFIAGLGILLPYIGPVASALLTVLVTLAVGGPAVSALQIAGIIAVYLIHNGIIEQFFIYPWVIGESLGLTTLETIIVVLLGGIFSGITGMIFALPTAAVVKYLVPQVYRCWK